MWTNNETILDLSNVYAVFTFYFKTNNVTKGQI